ncbi:MAG TPA: hypothetical protein GXX63_12120 [Tissierellia bacterium]|nr:hypothetical protein [Tissierellia bacterium]
MTKLEMVRRYFDFILGEELQSWEDRLDALMNEGRITTGARYYVYNSHRWHGVKLMDDITSRASKAKNYIVYINNRKKWDYEYAWKDIQKEFSKMKAFVEEQEALPYEKTQKQRLISNDELLIKEVKNNDCFE